MTEFSEAMALTASVDGGFTGELTSGWLIGGAINGGILLALGAQAMGRAVSSAGGGADVLAFSAHFLSASEPGPVTLQPEVLRVGRNLSTAQVSLRQGNQERVRLMGTVGTLQASTDPVHRQQQAPVIPPPEACVSAADGPVEMVETIKILQRLDLRLDPATAGFGLGAPTGAGELRGWLRTVDDHVPDPVMLAFALDAFPPVAFDLGAMGWSPTIEFTGHVRARPEPGWLQIQLTTANVRDGLLDENCVIWDSAGRVVAQSRQLAGVRMPQGPAA